MKERKVYSRIIQNVYPWRQHEKGHMISLLHASIENGSTSFDLSGVEGGGHIGENFGAALSESGLSRDEIQLVARSVDSSPENMEEKLDELLLSLGSDYLDLLLLANISDPEKVLQVYEKLFNQGKLHEIGIMGLPPGPFRSFGFEIQVFSTSVELLSNEVMERLEDQEGQRAVNMLFVDWQEKQLEPRSLESALKEVREKYQLSHQELLLVWLLQYPGAFNFVVQVTSEKEIGRLGELRDVRLHPFDWQEIKLILHR